MSSNKRIIFTRPDGGTSVIIPAPEMFDRNSKTRMMMPDLFEFTEEQILDFIKAKDVPTDAKDVAIINDSDLPSRDFRNAWKIAGNKIDHDMEKCRAIWKDKMRESRKPKLEALDVEYQRADEADDKVKKREISAKKQALRDITADPKIVDAKTPEELKAVWPEVLK